MTLMIGSLCVASTLCSFNLEQVDYIIPFILLFPHNILGEFCIALLQQETDGVVEKKRPTIMKIQNGIKHSFFSNQILCLSVFYVGMKQLYNIHPLFPHPFIITF